MVAGNVCAMLSPKGYTPTVALVPDNATNRFVNDELAPVPERFGKNPKSGARTLQAAETWDLQVLRVLQKGVR